MSNHFDICVICPECSGDCAQIRFNQKRSRVDITCPDCQFREVQIVGYGEGALVTKGARDAE